MESRILNFVDAMKLANILNTYINDGSIDGIELFSSMEVDDITSCIKIFSIDSTMSDEDAMNLLILLFRENEVISLVNSFRKIGFA